MQPTTSCHSFLQKIPFCNPESAEALAKNKSGIIIAAIAAIMLVGSLLLACFYHFNSGGLAGQMAAKLGPFAIYTTLVLSTFVGLLDLFFIMRSTQSKSGAKEPTLSNAPKSNAAASPVQEPKAVDSQSKSSALLSEKKPIDHLEKPSSNKTIASRDQILTLDDNFEVEQQPDEGWHEIEIGDNHIIPFEKAKNLISKEHFDVIEKVGDLLAEVNFKKFAVYDIPSLTAGKIVYALVYCIPIDNLFSFASGEKRIYFFDENTPRDTFITESLNDYEPWAPIRRICFGVPEGMIGPKGIVKDFHLDSFLIEQGASFTFECNLKEKPVYVRVMMDQGTLVEKDFETDLLRSEELRVAGANDYTDDINQCSTSFAKAILGDNGLIERLAINVILKAQGEYWLEPAAAIGDQKYPILFYHDGKSVRTLVFLNAGYQKTFIEDKKNNLNRNIKAEIEEDGEYPSDIGERILNATEKGLKTLKEEERGILKGEYKLIAFDNSPLPLFLLVKKKRNGSIPHRYFRTENTRRISVVHMQSMKSCVEREALVNKYVELIGRQIRKCHPEYQSTGLYHIESYKNEEYSYVVFFSIEGGIKGRYLCLPKENDELQGLVSITKIRGRTPLSEEEKRYLESETIQEISTYTKPEGLKVKEFAVIRRCNDQYTVICMRMQDKEGKPDFIIEFFRSRDTKLSEFWLSNLKGFHQI